MVGGTVGGEFADLGGGEEVDGFFAEHEVELLGGEAGLVPLFVDLADETFGGVGVEAVFGLGDDVEFPGFVDLVGRGFPGGGIGGDVSDGGAVLVALDDEDAGHLAVFAVVFGGDEEGVVAGVFDEVDGLVVVDGDVDLIVAAEEFFDDEGLGDDVFLVDPGECPERRGRRGRRGRRRGGGRRRRRAWR